LYTHAPQTQGLSFLAFPELLARRRRRTWGAA